MMYSSYINDVDFTTKDKMPEFYEIIGNYSWDYTALNSINIRHITDIIEKFLKNKEIGHAPLTYNRTFRDAESHKNGGFLHETTFWHQDRINRYQYYPIFFAWSSKNSTEINFNDEIIKPPDGSIICINNDNCVHRMPTGCINSERIFIRHYVSRGDMLDGF